MRGAETGRRRGRSAWTEANRESYAARAAKVLAPAPAPTHTHTHMHPLNRQVLSGHNLDSFSHVLSQLWLGHATGGARERGARSNLTLSGGCCDQMGIDILVNTGICSP